MTILVLLTIEAVHAQVYTKIGNNPGHLDSSAALEIESEKRGFLPPRMKETDRNAVSVSPDSAGLLVWCKDCNSSGQLCVYLGSNVWAPFTMLAASALTTAGNNDTANRPVRESATSATISGTLAEVFGTALPTETGVVWKEITDNDFAALPVLNTSGTPNYKATSPAVTTAGSPIKVTITNLTSANPYSFRTYAKSPSGISYGNAVIFNIVPPKFTIPVVSFTDGNTLLPVFKGKLTVNAGTLKGTITEYGYYSGATNPPPTTEDAKVVLSATATGRLTLDLLNEKLNSETFTANPAVSLVVNDYNVKSTAKTWFRYYAVANGETVYSDTVEFTPVADPVTGGTAIATTGTIEPISKPLKAGEESTSSFKVHFNVTKAGSYSFTPEASTGNTTDLTMPAVNGNFYAMPTDQTVTFTITGLPKTSLDGCSFVVPGIGTLNTGAIQPDAPLVGNIIDGNALCDASHTTAVVPVYSPKTGRVWMDRNLGASQAKTSTPADDYKAYGCLFQWGRGNDGHASINWTGNTSGTPPKATSNILATSDTPGDSFILPDNVNEAPWDWTFTARDYLWQGINGKNNPCPGGYRVPTSAELQAEIDAATLVSVLKVVRAPSRLEGNTIGFYYSLIWSSTVSTTTVRGSKALYFVDMSMVAAISYYEKRFKSFPVRCIKN